MIKKVTAHEDVYVFSTPNRSFSVLHKLSVQRYIISTSEYGIESRKTTNHDYIYGERYGE